MILSDHFETTPFMLIRIQNPVRAALNDYNADFRYKFDRHENLIATTLLSLNNCRHLPPALRIYRQNGSHRSQWLMKVGGVPMSKGRLRAAA